MLSLNIFLICLAIHAAAPYPYHHQQLLSTPIYNPQAYPQLEQRSAIYNKQFHVFAAPEESEDYETPIPQDISRKNVRVVVIKAPENKAITSAIARLSKTLSEGKTAIYVLNKEPDLNELITQIDRLKEDKAEAPDVHFIQYKNDDEAELATIRIKSQYESLSNPPKSNSEKVAPLPSDDVQPETKLESSVSTNLEESLVNESVDKSSLSDETTTVDKVVEVETSSAVPTSSNEEIIDELAKVFPTGKYLPPVTSGIQVSIAKYLAPYNDRVVGNDDTKS